MACYHVDTCPLFPYLNASLAAWREAYCDTEHAYLDCARYKMAARGEAVPLALLPNGRTPVAMLDRPALEAADPAAAEGKEVALLPAFPWEREPRPGFWARLFSWMRAAA